MKSHINVVRASQLKKYIKMYLEPKYNVMRKCTILVHLSAVSLKKYCCLFTQTLVQTALTKLNHRNIQMVVIIVNIVQINIEDVDV